MRLLRRDPNGTLIFVTANEEEYDTPYAILSHTWGKEEDEVTYQDVIANLASSKPLGFAKLIFTLDQAKSEGIQHVWIDTCCINKWNNTELGKSINLMYQWYARSAVCYVYLPDLSNGGPVSFTKSRWFSRGWTLQELIAPSRVHFYDRDRRLLGAKNNLSNLLHDVTGISEEVLRGASLDQVTIAERYRWSLNRNTKEPEDMSYCLIGILGITIPLQYGIGAQAAHKQLIKQVKKTHGDLVAEDIRNTLLRATPDLRIERTPFQAPSLRDLLRFNEMGSRQLAIEHAIVGTGAWLFDHPAYMQWMDSAGDQNDFLWIRGHPGAGKSTLMKLADLKSRETRTSDTKYISFYFNARGAELERTTTGMYRSLIYQLLKDMPHLEARLSESLSTPQESTLDRLKDVFRTTIAACEGQRVQCYIDALDECDLAEVQDMIISLQDISRLLRSIRRRFLVCLASRYYPTLYIKNSLELRLENQESHIHDLETYVSTRLDVDHLINAEEIKRQLVSRANGIFMWLVLVTRSLNQEIADGTIGNIQQVVRELPGELDDIYRGILSRADSRTLSRFRVCMQLLLFSRWPLRGIAMYHAVPHTARGMGFDEPFIDLPTPHPSSGIIERFISSASRGLAEWIHGASEWNDPIDKVQVIHESVRDFFIESGGLGNLVPDHHDHLDSWCHDNIKTLCLNYLDHAQARYSVRFPYRGSAIDLLASLSSELPLLTYAVHNVTWHAEQAAARISQNAFVMRCQTMLTDEDVGSYLGLHVQAEVPDHWRVFSMDTVTRAPSAIHAFVLLGCPRLVAVTTQLGYDLDRQFYGASPLEMAVWARSYQIVHQLIVYGASLDRFADLCHMVSSSGIFPTSAGPISPCGPEEVFWCPRNARQCSQYSRRVSENEVRLLGTDLDNFMHMLLSYGANIDCEDSQGRSLLFYMCQQLGEESGYNEHSFTGCITWLLEHHASVDLIGNQGWTALHAACANPWSGPLCIDTLLRHGADVNRGTFTRTTPLMLACTEQLAPTIRTLLQHGAVVDTVDEGGETALCRAVKRDYKSSLGVHRCDENGHREIISLLLEYLADTAITDKGGKTALLHALDREDECGEDMARQLAGHDHSIDPEYRPPLPNKSSTSSCYWHNNGMQ